MGRHLNSMTPYLHYNNSFKSPYFVDKSLILAELMPKNGMRMQYVCITRPRRFGKTVMANMIASFFSKGRDSRGIFDQCMISGDMEYHEHINKHDVIFISFNKPPENCTSYQQYIDRIKKYLKRDLREAYPEYDLNEDDSLWDILSDIFANYNQEGFIFVLDEWDYIFHKDFMSDNDKSKYIAFLCNLLKDQAYVSLAYMTGILPISKYSSGSELNMFLEYTMAKNPRFSEYFGFTEREVDALYDRHLEIVDNVEFTREDLRAWYDGYDSAIGERLYNPHSVVSALTNNHIDNYWTYSGPYDEIFNYVGKNIDDVRNDVTLMVSGEPVPADIREYAASSMELKTRDEIFSAMVVYGFLCYEDGNVRIPNRELMGKFEHMLQKEASFGYIHQLAKESYRMMRATMAGDTKTMSEILEYVHNTETPILTYNHEVELAAIVNLAYLSARDDYRVEREDKAGKGFVDFIFYPYKLGNDCIILELKVDASADEALEQVISKDYALRFKGRLGDKDRYNGRILMVGIGYYKDSKEHECKVRVYEM